MKVFPPLEPLVDARPPHWDAIEFRRAFESVEDSLGDRGLPLLSLSARAGDLAEREIGAKQQPSADYKLRYWEVNPGDLVVNPMWLIGGSIGVSGIRGAVSPDYRVYRSGLFEPRYVHHLLRSAPYFDQYKLLVRAQTTFDRRVTKQDFVEMPVLVPPLAEQRAIADYLDAETARIDALIAKKQQLIHLLEESLASQVSALVWGTTEHRTRLKYLTGLPTSGNRDHASFTTDDTGLPCLRGLNIRPARIDRRNLRFVSEADHRRMGTTILQEGDVVIVRSGLAGAAAVVPADLAPCNCVDLVVVKRSPRAHPKFVEYIVNSREAQEQVAQRSAGALLTHFNAIDAGRLSVPNLPVYRQQQIAEQLDRQTADSVKVTSALTRQIELLTERRQALITAAVTGEFTVPGAP